MSRDLGPDGFSRNGWWFLPDRPDERVPGLLTADGGVWRLTLLGALPGTAEMSDRPYAVRAAAPPPPIRTIFGDDGPITLWRCHEDGWHRRGKDVVEQRWICLEALEGQHLDEDAFEAIEFECDYLDEWYGESGLRGTSLDDGSNTWKYAPPPALVVAADGGTLSLAADIAYSEGRRALEIDERVVVRVEASSPLTTEDWGRDWRRPFTYLLTLASQSDSNARAVRYWKTADDWRGVVRDPSELEAPRERNRWELWIKDADVDLATFLPRWIDVCRRHATATDLVFANFSKSAGFMHSRVLNAVTAAEALDRGLHRDLRRTDQEERLARVLAAVGGRDKKWLQWKLRHAHEPTLAERLCRTVTPIRGFAEWLVGDVERWAEVSANARNRLAHRLAEVPDAEDDPDLLVQVADSAAFLVQARLLVEAGVDTASIERGAQVLPRCMALAGEIKRQKRW